VKFLIADDSPANLKRLRAGLEAEGHQVVEAANGIEALAVLERESVDAVITDIPMPSLDGLRLERYNAGLLCELAARVEQRTAALAAANKELASFSFAVSHDLRAPLRRISGFAHLLQETASSPDGEHRDFLKQIVDGAAQMEQYIEALLAFYRTARTELCLGDVDLESLLDETLILCRAELEDRHIEWRRSALPKVRGDKLLLREVFVNLLSNAIKYTRTRELASIEIGARQGPESEIVVFIRDNGVGFDMRYSEKLFGVFQRMHRTEEFEGTGIGLATAHRIVTRHGGSIWADAELGRGATFFFSLPRT
jgi:light-regulated signal transduction histidine kinase (bacteriophytochrome)